MVNGKHLKHKMLEPNTVGRNVLCHTLHRICEVKKKQDFAVSFVSSNNMVEIMRQLKLQQITDSI